MNLQKKIFLVLGVIGFCFQVAAQDLKLAAIQYFTAIHYPFEKDFIAENKIQVITKTNSIYTNDSLLHETLIEKYEFDTSGNPIYIYHKEPGYDKREIYFRYDSLNRLIKKDEFGISPELKYKNIETYEWQYDDLGFLIRQRNFRVINSIPTKNGASGFKEKYMLYTCDSIIYNKVNNSVDVISNNLANCADLAYSMGGMYYYIPNFKSIISTTLKFYENHSLYSIASARDSAIIQNKVLNTCGHPINAEKPKKIYWLEEITLKKIDCLSPEKINILKRVDTITVDGSLLFFEKNSSSDIIHRSMAPLFINTKQLIYYNMNLDIIYSEVTIDSSSESPPTSNNSFRKYYYEYHSNGLLKNVTVKDENDMLIEITAYKMTYFD